MVSTEHIIGYGKGAISLRFSREQRTSASKARGEREVGVKCRARETASFLPQSSHCTLLALAFASLKNTHTN